MATSEHMPATQSCGPEETTCRLADEPRYIVPLPIPGWPSPHRWRLDHFVEWGRLTISRSCLPFSVAALPESLSQGSGIFTHLAVSGCHRPPRRPPALTQYMHPQVIRAIPNTQVEIELVNGTPLPAACKDM